MSSHEDALRVESDVGVRGAIEAADEQAGADEQHHRERGLRHHRARCEAASARLEPPRLAASRPRRPRPGSPAARAGVPAARMVTAAVPRLNSSTRIPAPDEPKSISGRNDRARAPDQRATTNAAAAPAVASSTASASTSITRRPRGAPSAARTASSRRIWMPRVSSRFATFAQAINRTMALTTGEPERDRSRLRRVRAVARSRARRGTGTPAPLTGTASPPRRSTSRRALTCAVVICASAASSLTPGLSRISVLAHHHVRVFECVPAIFEGHRGPERHPCIDGSQVRAREPGGAQRQST